MRSCAVSVCRKQKTLLDTRHRPYDITNGFKFQLNLYSQTHIRCWITKQLALYCPACYLNSSASYLLEHCLRQLGVSR